MERRSRRGQTREQHFCGDWWDCRIPGCGSALLFPSPELIAWLEARRANLKNPEENRARHETDGTNRPITFRPTSEEAQHG